MESQSTHLTPSNKQAITAYNDVYDEQLAHARQATNAAFQHDVFADYRAT